MKEEQFGAIIEDPKMVIMAIHDQVMVMGRNDSEEGEFRKILSDLENGECTAEEAIEAAQAILDNKQDYN